MTSTESAIKTLDEAMRRIDLLTKNLSMARSKIADLYIERDQAWAALLDYHATLKASVSGPEAPDLEMVEELAQRHKVPLGAARVEMMGKEE